MRFWNRLLGGLVVMLFLGLAAGAAHATSMGGGPGPGSGCDPIGWEDRQIGQLLFSNFRFHSPSCSVDPSELTITNLDDEDGVGIEIAGPITLTGHGWAKFYVSYEVTAVDPLINGASLELDSSVELPTAAVFANKRVIGERPDKRVGHPGNHHGWGHLGWGLLHEHEGHDHGQSKTLAFLKTAEWDVDAGGFCEVGGGWLCEGEIPFDESSFDPQESVKVIDAVWIKALRGGEVEFVWSRNRFSVVPEPATAALLTIGLVGLAVLGRRV